MINGGTNGVHELITLKLVKQLQVELWKLEGSHLLLMYLRLEVGLRLVELLLRLLLLVLILLTLVSLLALVITSVVTAVVASLASVSIPATVTAITASIRAWTIKKTYLD